MRKYCLIFLLILSCAKTEKSIPKREVLFDSRELTRKSNVLYFKNIPFSGFIIEKKINDKLISKSGYLDGKLEGLQQKWFDCGVIKEIRFFEKNQKVGKHKGWYQNGQKRFEYFIENDIPIKTHREWYQSGQLFSLSNYNPKGQPEGLQQMWFEDGKIKANYVVKNGRRFGLLGAKGCMGVAEKKKYNY
jgi:antitoxin component YwqK of YwqJK toxin-antitoxin module